MTRKALPGASFAVLTIATVLTSQGVKAAPGTAPEFFTTIYNGRPVSYEIVNGFAVTEGDMVIGEAKVQTDGNGRRTVLLQKYRLDSHTVALASNLWPKVAGIVTVPYTIIHGGQTMTDAIAAFNTLFAGQIKWAPRTNQRNYVEIDLNNQSLNSCYATLGYTGGKESLQGVLGGCSVSANLHEMGHIMGFAHEQSRANRNSFIAIDFSNIAPSSQGQYTQELSTTMDLGLYDYSSLMHYGPRGFTRNGNPEMESIPVGITFGDPPTFSTGDVDAMNRLYFTPPQVVTITSNPAGLQILVDGASYTAPQSFTWALNSQHVLSVPSGPQMIGGANYIFGRWNSDLTGDLNPTRSITVMPGSGTLGSPASAPAITAYQVNYIKLAQFTPTPVLDNTLSTVAAAGSVSTTPPPQTFPGVTGQFFVNRSLVTLNATPAAGNSFYSYGGDNTGIQRFGSAANPVTLPSDLLTGTFYVRFASVPEVLITTNITNNNASGVAVQVDGGSSSAALPHAWALPLDAGWGAGTTHPVVAVSPVSPFFDPNTRYTFSNWTDGVTTASRSITVPAAGLLSVGANYSAAYHVTANANSACAGSVSVSPLPPADGFVASGSQLTVVATAVSPFVFAGFSGGTITSNVNPVSLTATGEVVATANFNTINSPLAITSVSPASLPKGSPDQTITISGSGFTPNTDFFLNNAFRAPTYVDANTLTVTITASDFTAAGLLSTYAQNVQAGCSVYTFGPALVVTP